MGTFHGRDAADLHGSTGTGSNREVLWFDRHGSMAAQEHKIGLERADWTRTQSRKVSREQSHKSVYKAEEEDLRSKVPSAQPENIHIARRNMHHTAGGSRGRQGPLLTPASAPRHGTAPQPPPPASHCAHNGGSNSLTSAAASPSATQPLTNAVVTSGGTYCFIVSRR